MLHQTQKTYEIVKFSQIFKKRILNRNLSYLVKMYVHVEFENVVSDILDLYIFYSYN